MNYFNHFLFIALFSLSLGTLSFAQDAEYKRIRVGAQFSTGKSLVHATQGSNSLNIKEDARYIFMGPAGFIEYSLTKWLAFGAQYRALFERGHDGSALHDIDVYPKFIFPNKADKKREFFFMLPAGYSTLNQASFANCHGFNIGALVGGNYYFTDAFGFTAQGGYVYRRIDGEMADASKTKLAFNFHELAASVGLIIRF